MGDGGGGEINACQSRGKRGSVTASMAQQIERLDNGTGDSEGAGKGPPALPKGERRNGWGTGVCVDARDS